MQPFGEQPCGARRRWGWSRATGWPGLSITGVGAMPGPRGLPGVAAGGGFYALFDRAFAWLPRPTRAMIAKDLAVFWRDPGQWSQLMILFGLLFIYMINLRNAAEVGQFRILIPFWQSLISMFNIGATAFVLSILTTRFVYPMLSLEGRQQWVIGLAPVGRTRLVWIKFFISWTGALVLCVPLALLSCFMLRADGFVTATALLTVAVLSLGLSSLAVGLGALMPNFSEDNPARIANGLGGNPERRRESLVHRNHPWRWKPRGLTHICSGGLPEGGMGRMLTVASFALWVLLQTLMAVAPAGLGAGAMARRSNSE